MHTLRPGQDGYAEEVAGFQTSVASQPAVVVAAESAEDVVAAVRYAAEHDLPVSVQATGHGLTAGTGGLLISTRRMTDVEIDAGAKTARVAAGVRWGAVIEAAAKRGLALLSGRAGFGVVTALEFGLVPVTELYGGGLYFDAAGRPAGRRAGRAGAM